MRPMLYGDLHVAARRLAGLDPHRQRQAIGDMLTRAHAADLWRKRKGTDHPDWGNGSLTMAASKGWPEPAGPVTELAYLGALTVVAKGIVTWRLARSPAPQRGAVTVGT